MFSSICWGEVGDVYNCETEKYVEVKLDSIKEHKSQNFKFERKIDLLEFEGGFFDGLILPVDFNGGEYFDGNDITNIFIYREGNFIYSKTKMFAEDGKQYIVSIIASCDIY